MKQKFDWKRSIITIGIVLVTALAVGGTVWYVMDKGAQEIKAANDSLLEQLPTKKTDSYTPVVAFEPAGLFTESEMNEIKTKITTPLLAYENESELNVVSVLIHKYEENQRPAGYMYSAIEIFKNNGTGGWLFGETGKAIDYWKPQCMNECPISDKFRATYPNNI